MSGGTRVRIRVRMAWWLPLYMLGTVILARILGRAVNQDKVRAKVRRGLRVEVRR